MRSKAWLKSLCAILLIITLLPIALPALADEGEDGELILEPLPEDRPGIRILSPGEADTVEEGNIITVDVEGVMLSRIEIIASWEGGETSIEGDGAGMFATLSLPPIPGNVTVVARGYGLPDASGNESVVEDQCVLLSPKQKMIEDMIALAQANLKDKRYKFARAQDDGDVGVCKNFVMRLFNTFKDGHYMLEYPDLDLHMPLNRRLAECKPYQYGIEWALEGPADGAPFEIVSKFRYDTTLSKAENQKLAREFLMNVKRGDFYQMVGNYVDGNGPHSLLFIYDYDPAEDMLRWTDSNMKGKRIDGARWGYLQFDTKRTVDWMVKAICTKNRGATLYRLRDDLVKR